MRHRLCLGSSHRSHDRHIKQQEADCRLCSGGACGPGCVRAAAHIFLALMMSSRRLRQGLAQASHAAQADFEQLPRPWCKPFTLACERLNSDHAQVAHVAEAVFEQLTHTQNFYHGLGEALPMLHIKACTYLGSCNATSRLHLYHISPWTQACASLSPSSDRQGSLPGMQNAR